MSDHIEESQEDLEYIHNKKMMRTMFDKIKNMEKQIIDIRVAFDDAQRANAYGVQNVYNKFIEIEKRQVELEDLLQSDRVKAMIDSIPNEDTIHRMFAMIEGHPIIDLLEGIDNIRGDLQELVDRFTL